METPVQTPHFAVSYLGLHSLHRSVRVCNVNMVLGTLTLVSLVFEYNVFHYICHITLCSTSKYSLPHELFIDTVTNILHSYIL